VVLTGRAAPVLLLALLKVLRTVDATWIIAALQERVPVTCQGSRAARCALTGVEGTRAVKYVNLGSAGLRVSRICLGMMSYGDNTDRAWAQGEERRRAHRPGGRRRRRDVLRHGRRLQRRDERGYHRPAPGEDVREPG
jgi:hypothetical protein